MISNSLPFFLFSLHTFPFPFFFLLYFVHHTRIHYFIHILSCFFFFTSTAPLSRSSSFFHSFLFYFSFTSTWWFQKLSGSLNFFSLFFPLDSRSSPQITADAIHFRFLTYMKQIARGPELNIEKPHDLEVIGYGIESEPNTVGSIFLCLPLLLLSFCLSACLWLFGRGFVLFDFCSFGL